MTFSLFETLQNRESPLIIAEIGANYGGMDVVKQMVRKAAQCGVDMVKFQTYKAETISTPGSFTLRMVVVSLSTIFLKYS